MGCEVGQGGVPWVRPAFVVSGDRWDRFAVWCRSEGFAVVAMALPVRSVLTVWQGGRVSFADVALQLLADRSPGVVGWSAVGDAAASDVEVGSVVAEEVDGDAAGGVDAAPLPAAV